MRTALIYLFLLAAAALEVGGDAITRKGLRGGGLALVALGFVAVGAYSVVVNLAPWDFSKLLGVYVTIFATVAVLVGRFSFRDVVPASTWVGLAIIIAGGLVIQFGRVWAK